MAASSLDSNGPAPVAASGEEPYASAEFGALHGTLRYEGKVPERFVVVKEFPRTGTDKIQRRLVAEQLAARPTAPRR